jgi:polar amino acid transport system permease protein
MGDWQFRWEDIRVGLPLLSKGLAYTIGLSLASFVPALVFGTALGWLREEVKGLPGMMAALYIEFLRGIPLILLLVFIHYGLLPMLFGPGSFMVSALLALVLFESACIGEIMRSGFRTVRPAEREAAKSLGLNEAQQLRFVVLPMAFRRMTPALVGQFVSLIKDTSLASIVGVIELTRAGEIISEQRFHDFEILAFVAVVYFVVCFSLSHFSRRFESIGKPAETILARSLG